MDYSNVIKEINEIINMSEEEGKAHYNMLNEVLRLNELRDEKELERVNNTNLYPSLNDNNFNLKIANKKEFKDTSVSNEIYNVKERQNLLCNMSFELSLHQMFVRNYLSYDTPYKSLLLYHGVGTGKTCSAITICEEMRKYLKQISSSKKILVVASPNVQDNFKLQLFDERKLVENDGLWNMSSCSGNIIINEINPMNMKGIKRNVIIGQANKIINESYEFVGYTEFSNIISKVINKNEKNIKNIIKQEFSNRLLVIDEIHNVRFNDEVSKNIVNNLELLVRYSVNLKLLLLSATPLFNSYKEIIWLLNLMNLNDNRSTIELSDVFDKDGKLKEESIDSGGFKIESGRDLLIRKARGYISYVRGDNPYTFPIKIYPMDYGLENSIKRIEKSNIDMIDNEIDNNIELLDLFMTNVGEYQEIGYMKILEKIKESLIKEDSEEKKKFNYTTLEPLIQGLTMIYPSININNDNFNYRDLIGKNGLDNIMNFNIKEKNNFVYKESEFGRIFDESEIMKYSGKLYNLSMAIKKSKGIVMIYSQYIDGGCIPVALLLESMGITRYKNKSLMKNIVKKAIDSITMEERKEGVKFTPAKYVMITGDKQISPNNLEEFKVASGDNNKNGEKVKVIIISRAGSEGLDFTNIRQIHILEPWYNMSRIEQTIGRAVRNCSHKKLEYEERNTQVFLYGTRDIDRRETSDLYVYRIAEKKAKKIGEVTRILKESSIDCLLRESENRMTQEDINQEVEQVLSTGEIIKIKVGDKGFSAICDYMSNCNYKCIPEMTEENNKEDIDTYNENYMKMNSVQITKRIKEIFLDKYVLRESELIKEITILKDYPLNHIYMVLEDLINNKTVLIYDRYGRVGNLVNVGDLYMYQPVELNNTDIGIFERSIPLEYKPESIKLELNDLQINNEKEVKLDLNTEKNLITEVKNKFRTSIINEDDRVIMENIEKEWMSEIDNQIFKCSKKEQTDREKERCNKCAEQGKEEDIKEGKKGKKSKKNKYKGYQYNKSGEVICMTQDQLKDFKSTQLDSDKKSWEKATKISYEKMVKILNKLDYKYTYELHLEFIMNHILDEYFLDEKLEILNYITDKKVKDLDLDQEDNLIYNYFKENILSENGLKGIIFINRNKDPLLFVFKDNKWNYATPVEKEYFIKHFSLNKTIKYGNIIGFIDKLKDILTFKTKNKTDKFSIGARCDNAGIKNIKLILQELRNDLSKMDIIDQGKRNQIEEEERKELDYKAVKAQESKEFVPEEDKQMEIFHKSNYINDSYQLCSEIELILRFLDKQKVDDKRWFFNYEEKIIMGI